LACAAVSNCGGRGLRHRVRQPSTIKFKIAVTVNSQSTYRKGEYFRKELAVNNGSSALWTNIVVAATGQTSVTGHVFVAKAPETFGYDADGNLTNDGRWAFTWDAENRLTSMTSLSSGPAGSKLKLDFAYDYQGRRIQKIVSTNNGSSYIPQSTNKFLYDGWNLIAILNPQSSLIESFMWGNDLSGSQQGAGGVGGLLLVTCHSSPVTNCFVSYDGNGNVAALVNAAGGAVLAQYEYGNGSVPSNVVLATQLPSARSRAVTLPGNGSVS
jgi:YD repeat-containing protein